ncbi:MAG: hypothetical protein Q8S11_10105 [Daejeonella sp.]|uniref:hypothetical protein n=1 Tax=Daejeonella sp. TaxID=2805397 RepID=UPI002733E7F8|nr:hypothetical protein [Daejeonella sp.]MDP3468676.1 hypothetical protein [Daejeonella sp.]
MDRPEGPKPVKKGWGLIKKVLTAYLERISDWKVETVEHGARNVGHLHFDCKALYYFRKI